MTVSVENLGGGGKPAETGFQPPSGTQSHAYGDPFLTSPFIGRGWNTYYFTTSSGAAGAFLNPGFPPHYGLQVSPVADGVYWIMFTSWVLAWMNGGRFNNLSQFGLWNVSPSDGGLIHGMAICSGTVGSISDISTPQIRPSGAYASTCMQSPDDPPNVLRLSIDLLEFGESAGAGPLSVNPPRRTTLLDCGTVRGWSFEEQNAGERGGTLVRFQAVNRVDRWELAVWVAQDYYPAAPGTPVNWENRGHVFDDFLDTGMPGFGVSNTSSDPTVGVSGILQGGDFYQGWETNPWQLDWYAPEPARGVSQPPREIARQWNTEPVPHTFLNGKLIL